MIWVDCAACSGTGEDPSTQGSDGCVHLVCYVCDGMKIVPDGTIETDTIEEQIRPQRSTDE